MNNSFIKNTLLLVIILFNSVAYAQSRDRFEITISSVNDEFAIVNARLVVNNGRLFTGVGGSYDWERGWADFVTDLKATKANGVALTITEQGESFDSYWHLQDGNEPYNGVVEVNYKVDLSYVHTDWDFGNEQAGKTYKNALYSVTKPFFLSSGVDRETEIFFDMPDSWQLASPWEKIGRNLFVTDTWAALETNAIALGEFQTVSGMVHGFDLQIILMGEFPSAPPLITETINQVLPVYLDLFPDTEPEKYLMFYLSGPSEDAEAFRNGAAFTTSLSLSASNRIFWADFLAHELFHFWNGTRIRAMERWQGNWFSEGFTDYYANLVLVNRGVLSEEWFIRRMENIFGNYLWFHSSDIFEGLSVLEAGKEKGRNRFGVYDAGWVLAFALDAKIRRETGGEKSLDDAMDAIYQRFGRTGKNYELDELLETIAVAAELDLTGFFEQYLKQRNALPLVDIMKAYGLDSYSNAYANEYYITKSDGVDAQAQARWSDYISNRFPITQ